MSLVMLTPRSKGSNKGKLKSEFEQLSISIAKVKPLIKLLASEGVDLNELLSGTGLLLRDIALCDLSISCEQYLQLIDNAYRLMSGSCFGLRLGEQFYVNHDGLLACRVMSSENAEQAMFLLKNYQSLLTLLLKFDFKVLDRHAVFSVQPAYRLNNSLPFFIEYTFAAIYSIGKFCIGTQNLKLSYEFSYENPSNSDAYNDFFDGPVRFGCEQNRVLVPLEVLKQPFIFADKATARMSDEICQDKVCSIEDNVDIRQRVRLLIRNSKPFGISLDALAEELCMSPRTLSRQLKAYNATYKSILEEERKQMALQIMNDHDISLDQLGERLGYQDASSFSRAFKKWFGVPPNKFKR